MIGLSIYLALVDKVQQFSEENKMIYSHSENERCSVSFSALNMVRLLCFSCLVWYVIDISLRF